MKNSWPIIRISLAFVAVFALGYTAGRFAEQPSTQPPTQPITQPITQPDTPVSRDYELTHTGQRVMAKYQEALGLTEEQIAKMEPIFARVSQRMAVFPRHSRGRLAVLEDFHDELDPMLTETQRSIANDFLELSRSVDRTQ